MATEAEDGGNRFFNGRIFKLMPKPEQRKDIRIFFQSTRENPTPELTIMMT